MNHPPRKLSESTTKKDDGELKPHFMGHHFHYAEVAYIFFILAGIAFFAISLVPGLGDNSIMRLVAGITYAVSAGFALSLIWNLASIKRIAAAADMLSGDVETFKAENSRARDMQKVKRQQDTDMKDKVADLGKAQVLLKGSVTGLEDVKKQEEEMMAEQMGMLEARRALCEKLKKDMADLSKQTLAEAKEELFTRCTLYFEEHDEDDDGMTVGDSEWNFLVGLLADNGIKMDAKAAGDDGHLTYEEFQEFLEPCLKDHFKKLKVALMKSEELALAIQDERMKRVK